MSIRDIARGTRVLAERPLIKVYMKSPESIVEQIKTAFGRLPPAQKDLYEDLYSADPATVIPPLILTTIDAKEYKTAEEHPNTQRLVSVFYTNHFVLDFLSPHTGALFTTVSRVNHSCVPNAHWAYNDQIDQMAIHATRDIPAGTEITISYTPSDMRTRDQRQYDLRAFGFTCRCEACENPGESDVRRARMAVLYKFIKKYTDGAPTKEEYQTALTMTEEFVNLYETESLTSRDLERRYHQAAKINYEIGDLPEAVKWAERLEEHMLVCLGEDHKDYKSGASFLSRMRNRAKLRALG
ncbi:MAG: hypothetical protein M1821_001535 [Bathelium mastoideum]|nr:MAG: hypothetical protein M1821_001535 [Bathelium mastoideum]KAI9691422.1 MAG: hypothetical protein M1822_007493 [Bathelium mastoideum]